MINGEVVICLVVFVWRRWRTKAVRLSTYPRPLRVVGMHPVENVGKRGRSGERGEVQSGTKMVGSTWLTNSNTVTLNIDVPVAEMAQRIACPDHGSKGNAGDVERRWGWVEGAWWTRRARCRTMEEAGSKGEVNTVAVAVLCGHAFLLP